MHDEPTAGCQRPSGGHHRHSDCQSHRGCVPETRPFCSCSPASAARRTQGCFSIIHEVSIPDASRRGSSRIECTCRGPRRCAEAVPSGRDVRSGTTMPIITRALQWGGHVRRRRWRCCHHPTQEGLIRRTFRLPDHSHAPCSGVIQPAHQRPALQTVCCRQLFIRGGHTVNRPFRPEAFQKQDVP